MEGCCSHPRRLREPRLPREEAAAHGLPDVRDLQRPPGRQPGLTAPGTMGERGPQGPVTDRGPLLDALGVELDEDKVRRYAIAR